MASREMPYIAEPEWPDEDELYERTLQRKLDDEAEAKRRASGVSIEQLALVDAHCEGARVGAQGLSHSLNPFQSGTPEHEAWDRGWHAASAMRAARMVA